METPSGDCRAGWGRFYGSLREHYFLDGRSLCRKHGIIAGILRPASTQKPCLDCERRLTKLEKKQAEREGIPF